MAKQEFTICEAGLEDAQALAATLAQVLSETDFLAQDDASAMTVEEVAQFIDNRQNSLNEICLLAKIGSDVAGLLNISAQKNFAFEHIGDIFLAVKKDYWNYGIGQILLQEAVDWAEHSGVIRRLELTVQKRNSIAVHVYENAGFVIEGVKERGIKTRDGEFLDVYVMSKLIN